VFKIIYKNKKVSDEKLKELLKEELELKEDEELKKIKKETKKLYEGLKKMKEKGVALSRILFCKKIVIEEILHQRNLAK
jgi:hypothetical protein